MKKGNQRKRLKRKVRTKVKGTGKCPRLSVFRSNKFIYAQLIDDTQGKTMVSLSELNLKDISKEKKTKTEIAFILGNELAAKAKKKKVNKVVFDRSFYKYHGRVKAFAEGARKGGLKF